MTVTGRNEREEEANTNETTLKFIACYDSWSNHTDVSRRMLRVPE